MYTFILEHHKETYSLFYHEVTGKTLTVSCAQGRLSVDLLWNSLTVVFCMSLITIVCKRKCSSVKEEPKRKIPKTADKGPVRYLRL